MNFYAFLEGWRNKIVLTVLFNWIYIFFVTQVIGFGGQQIICRILKIPTPQFKLSGNIMCGIVITTVYAQYFSLFHKIGVIANLILIILCIIIVYVNKKSMIEYMVFMKNVLFSWEGLLYIGVLLLAAFFTSRGSIHTDTNIYHAQAIRWYEEFGVVKGLGNLQQHFAYNSSYFAFAALFGLKFLCGQSLHTTTGFIGGVLCIWALYHLKGFFEHERHMTDLCCIGILFYALVNLTGFVSPASDYATMFMALYVIARWCEEIESEERNIHDKNYYSFSLLCVMAVYVATLKLSAGLLILLVIFPIVSFVRKRDIRAIVTYLILGIAVVLPFLIRNIIISGWLLYPFPSLDLFHFDWKIPIEYVEMDSAQIKVWGRCLYDIGLIDMPVSEWFPIWWREQERYAQMLILTNCLAGILDCCILVHRLFSKVKINWNLVLLNVVVFCNVVAWFMLSPFIRYGLAFLLAFPLLSVGMWMQKEKSSFYKIVSGCIVVLMFFILTPYWDHYFTDDMVFLKQNLMQPYYIKQKEYETSPMEEFDMNGITIYSPAKGEITGYQYFPASTYDEMIRRTELRGKSLKDGFKPKKD